jgi:hypothetical protein
MPTPRKTQKGKPTLSLSSVQLSAFKILYAYFLSGQHHDRVVKPAAVKNPTKSRGVLATLKGPGKLFDGLEPKTSGMRTRQGSKGKRAQKKAYRDESSDSEVTVNLQKTLTDHSDSSGWIDFEILSATPQSVPARTKDPQNLLTREIGEHWRYLSRFDTELYRVQRGIPDGGTAIPYSWDQAALKLNKAGFFTMEQLSEWGGTCILSKRYEDIRQIVDGQYAAKEPKDLDDVTIRIAEGFDVFDYPRGEAKYEHKNLPEFLEGKTKFTYKEYKKMRKKKHKPNNEDDEAIVVSPRSWAIAPTKPVS